MALGQVTAQRLSALLQILILRAVRRRLVILGVSHLLVRAETGEVAEYTRLKEKTIVPEVAAKIADFLRRPGSPTSVSRR